MCGAGHYDDKWQDISIRVPIKQEKYKTAQLGASDSEVTALKIYLYLGIKNLPCHNTAHYQVTKSTYESTYR